MNKITKLFGLFAAAMAFSLVTDSMVNTVSNEVVHEDNIVYESTEVKSLAKPDGYKNVDEEPERSAEGVEYVTIHYHNDDGLNAKRRYYIWITGVNGVEVVPDEVSADGSDMVITLDFKADWQAFLNQPELKFIIKFANTWAGQSEDLTIDYSVFTPDAEGNRLFRGFLEITDRIFCFVKIMNYLCCCLV